MTLSWRDEMKLWWELDGALTMDLATYFAICATVGLVEGPRIGQLMLRAL